MKRFLFYIGLLVLAACARQVTPEGGPKDTTPPAVVPEKSTPDKTTRFNKREIRLSFDEWIVLEDAANQVLVSPPLLKRPEVSLKGKTVILKFKEEEVLRPQTTYTINFGTAVKDLHEKNPAKDLRFVFSTGDFIDSLTVSGTVVDAYTGDPLENIAVMLYDNPDDSIVRKERPYYLARTDKGGAYTIPNVREGVFKCIAIEDANQNLKWDGESERIGFPEAPVMVSDSTRNVPPLRVFKPAPVFRLVSPNAARYGQVKLPYTATPDSIVWQPDLPSLKWVQERDLDTLLFWYDRPDSTSWNLIAGKDTVAVKALSRTAFLAANQLAFAGEVVVPVSSADRKRIRQAEPEVPAVPRPVRQLTVNPGKPLVFSFNNPVTNFDTTRWVLNPDSVPTRAFRVTPDSSGPRALRLALDWEPGKSYLLTLLPGAVTDLYGTSNVDTLQRTLAVPTEKQLGALNLTIVNLKPETQYVLRLLNGTALEEERIFTADSTERRFVFPKLQPVQYTVTMIADFTKNGRWDPGDYFAHRQPEPVFTRKLEQLRANWEVEATLDATLNKEKKKKE